MVTMAMKHFDILSFVKKSKELGTSEELAEYQARKIEEAIDIAVSVSRQENKHDFSSTNTEVVKLYSEIKQTELRLLKEIEVVRKEIEIVRKEIAQSSNKTIIWLAGLLGTFGVFFLSVLAKGFHWI
jgi:hypothetical protein